MVNGYNIWTSGTVTWNLRGDMAFGRCRSNRDGDVAKRDGYLADCDVYVDTLDGVMANRGGGVSK